MTTPYNTGKVKIGAAYTPRLRPEYSHAHSGPHKRRFFDRPDRIVMRACLVAIVVFALLQLAGCGAEKPTANASSSPRAADSRAWETFGPDEHGVVCYRKIGFEGVSCVQVVQR